MASNSMLRSSRRKRHACVSYIETRSILPRTTKALKTLGLKRHKQAQKNDLSSQRQCKHPSVYSENRITGYENTPSCSKHEYQNGAENRTCIYMKDYKTIKAAPGMYSAIKKLPPRVLTPNLFCAPLRKLETKYQVRGCVKPNEVQVLYRYLHVPVPPLPQFLTPIFISEPTSKPKIERQCF